MKIAYTENELAEIEVKKEIAMKTAGVERFFKNNERAIKSGAAGDTDWNRRIIQELVEPMSTAIDTYIDFYKGKAGKPAKSLTFLKLLPSKQAAYITIKSILNSLTRETNILTVAKSIGQRIEDQVRFQAVDDEAKNYMDIVKKRLAQSNSHKYEHRQRTYAQAEASLIAGNKDRGIEGKTNLVWNSWLDTDLIQLGSHLINMFSDNVLFEGKPIIEKKVEKANKRTKTTLVSTKSIQDWIEKYKDTMQYTAPAFAPTVIKPLDWTSPTSGAYHVKAIADTLPLIKCSKHQRDRLTIEQMPEVYSAVNALQAVEWTINERVLQTAQTCTSKNLTLGIPSREPYEFTNAPIPENCKDLRGADLKAALTEKEFNKFVEWKRETNILYGLENKRKADFLKFVSVLGSARQYSEFKSFHFVYTMDFRGRIYCRSDTFSPQGNDFQKGLINFANSKELGENGKFWLAVHGANCYGNDKITFEERVAFIDTMEDTIRDIATDPIEYREWAGADKPWQFLNWCFEWSDLMDWIEAGNKASKFKSHTAVAMDGSCSGIQHYSAMLRDSVGGAAVNLVPDNVPHDIYAEVAKVVVSKLNTFINTKKKDKDSINNRLLSQAWLDIQGGITRGLCKSPVMTLPYGSTQIRCLQTTNEYLVKLQEKEDQLAKAENREPISVHPFTTDKKKGILQRDAEVFMSKVIWSSIGEVVIAAKDAMKYIQEIAKQVAKENSRLEWVTPTGFIVEQKELDYTTRRVKTQLMGLAYIGVKRELKTINVRKMKSASAPNFIHSMDASHLVKAINLCKQTGINDIAVIHDSFGTYASQVELLRENLTTTFVNMYEENDVLSEFRDYNENLILKEIEAEAPEAGDLNLKDLVNSEYCFA